MIETYRFDRCDRCGAKGQHRATRDNTELILCQHHYDQHHKAFMVRGWEFERMLTNV